MMSQEDKVFCTQCGKQLAADASFCEQCGARQDASEPSTQAPPEITKPPPKAAPTRSKDPDEDFLLAWEMGIPMVNNPFFLWDMVKLWGIPCILLFLLMIGMWLADMDAESIRFALIIPPIAFAGFYVFSLVIALVFFFNRYYVRTALSGDGVLYEAAKWTGKLSKAVSAGNLILGALTSSPQGLAAGIVGDMQRSVLMQWKDIRKVSFFPGLRVITLSNSWRPVLRLHCPTDEIFGQARESIEREVVANGGTLTRK
ncbi:MAG: zinc ribbon domain-containing protein [bacterium]|nr:zinc ribbon domain-containing protein [bacterium]